MSTGGRNAHTLCGGFYRHPVTAAQERMRSNAVKACCSAEDAAMAGRDLNINDLDEPRRLAAHARLYAGLAQALSEPGKRRKTMTWLGRRWYLVPRGCGRLEVQAYRGVPGLVSMPGALP